MDCSQPSYQDAFKRINAVAHGIRAICKTDNVPLSVPRSPTASTSYATHLPTLRLPLPEIPALLESAPCSPEVKASIKAAFIQGAGRIRDNCQSKYINMAKLSLSCPSKAANIITFFEKQYQEQIVALQELTIAKVRQQPLHVDNSAKEKTVFNREFIPLLETYFTYNAYPSALDRATLARKSMMTPRQIEVWFQNHRNRAKKEGRPLKKLATDPLPLEISMKPLERKMSFFVIPEDQRQDPSRVCPPKEADLEAGDVVQTSEGRLNAKFNFHPPPHAFPSAYPPTCDYNPFPTKAGTYKFPAPIWYRTPAIPRRPSKIPLNMDEFIEDFSIQLHLRVPVLKQERQKQPWCAGRAIIPPSAPHPALVRCPLSPISKRMARFPTVPAPSSRLRPFRSPSPYSRPTTLVPPQHVSGTPTRRKIAALPKRTPKNASITHCRGSPAVSEASPLPSRSSSSTTARSSSFASLTSSDSDRRPSSSDSSSSASSSVLNTPVLGSSELPEDPRSPVSVSGADYQDVDDLFGSNSGKPFHFSLESPSKRPQAFTEIPLAEHLGFRRSPRPSRASPS